MIYDVYWSFNHFQRSTDGCPCIRVQAPFKASAIAFAAKRINNPLAIIVSVKEVK